MDVVVVESPAKAKTINKYLGSGYRVLASFGHVRDLPAKKDSVRPDEDFAMSWEIDGRARKRIDDIADALDGAEHLYLATDPDREGEAISWHVRELLDERRALDNIDVKRVVFHEITRDAVTEAMSHPREINRELVEAYLARRALDYLVGFTLSPVLWRKLPGSRSAGRVHSVALRLICERESEIEAFKPQEYWTVDAAFQTAREVSFTARLTHFGGDKLDKMALGDEAAAQAAVAAIEAGNFTVAKVERKQSRRNPYPPFTTSTLQQEASRKLRFAANQTMRLAQQLYEGIDIGGETVGLITYMRTDSVTLAGEALGACRRLIGQRYGEPYLPDQPRMYRTKAKNAQEAHEAIRPTDVFRTPDQVAGRLDPDQRRLYDLIWKRTVASQMASAVLDQVAVDLATGDRATILRANGSVVRFDGFFRLYQEGRDDSTEDEREERILPDMAEGEAVRRGEVMPEQHFTQPPPRFSEASLVKNLEELGIGRPSTYASIIQVLQDRDYVVLDKRRFIPEDRGRLVTAFLTSFFRRYVEYNFTAELEDQLDDISNGRAEWKAVLREFWQAFNGAIEGTADLSITQVLDALDQDLGPHFFPEDDSGTDPRACPSCGTGRLGLRLGKFGAFIGCANYPECKFTRPLVVNGDDRAAALAGEGRSIGSDPKSGEAVSLRAGPYGPYVQLGEASDDEKPKRVSLPKDIEIDAVDLDLALRLLALPREVGAHPESGEMITAGIGRYGPYVKHGKIYKSLPGDDDVLAIGLNRAVALLAEAKAGRGGPAALRTIGDHPDDGKPITLHDGRYGPYVKHGRTNASLRKAHNVETITLKEAVELIAARVAKGKGGRKKPATKSKAKGKAKSKTKSKAKGAKRAKRKTSPTATADD